MTGMSKSTEALIVMQKSKATYAKKKPAAAKSGRKVGRPSKYDPRFCELVLDLGAKGKSKAQMAATIGIDRGTLNEWVDVHPEFSRAINAALDLSLARWETIGQEHMLRPGFNATAFIFQMKNRFREDYRDLQHGEHKITQTQEPKNPTEPISATLAWIQEILGKDPDGRGTTIDQSVPAIGDRTVNRTDNQRKQI
jgi:hypothetical protein